MDVNKFFVSRQKKWDTGECEVEISQGGCDYSGPDMLTAKWQHVGEGKEFADPREAVEAAILVRTWWKSMLPDEEIFISFGCTHGNTVDLDRFSDEELKKKADELYEKLPKCAACSNLLPAKGKRYGNEYSTCLGKEDQYAFCSESCAEEDQYRQEQEAASVNDEDGYLDD